jgi:hypothetical protein
MISRVSSPGISCVLEGVAKVYGPDAEVPATSEFYPGLLRLADAILLENGTTNRAAMQALALADGTPLVRVLADLVRTPSSVVVKLTAEGGHILPRKGRREPTVRQITLADGSKVDIRNRANFDLLIARIEEVEAVAQSYLHQYRVKGVTKGQRRRLICELHRAMLLRGKDLSRALYGSICLRVGAPLPPDFWTVSSFRGNGSG